MTVQVNIASDGRISLSIDIAERPGFENGRTVLIDKTEEGFPLRTVAQAVARAKVIAKRYTEGNDDASVDAFLTQRKAESGG